MTRALWLVTALVAGSAWARMNGVTTLDGGVATPPNCNDCHTGGGAPTVTVTGPISVVTGSTNMYTVTIAGGAANAGGFNAAVSTPLAVVMAGTGSRVMDNQVTHQAPLAFANGIAQFIFPVRAPNDAGTFTLVARGNSVNNDGTRNGDNSALAAPLMVTVTFPVPDAGADAGGGDGGGEGGTGDGGVTFVDPYLEPAPGSQSGGIQGGGCSAAAGLPLGFVLLLLWTLVLLGRARLNGR